MLVDYIYRPSNIYFGGPQAPWSVWHFFLGVNWSGPKMSSTTNQRSYMALKWLHGPWCKQPLGSVTSANFQHDTIWHKSILLEVHNYLQYDI
jgi:hypothetical protein